MDDPFDEWVRSSSNPCLREHASTLLALGATWDTFSGRRPKSNVVDSLVSGGIPPLAAHDIVDLATEAVSMSAMPLAVFWDLENMPLPSASRGRDVVARIKSILNPHGSLVQFRAYASIGLNLVAERKRSELQLSGCHLVDCPHLGRKEVADKMIIVDAMKFAFENPNGAALCFVTGDVDYAYLLSVLRERPKVRTIVISKGTLQSMLHVNCDVKMRWEADILQLLKPSNAAAAAPAPVSTSVTTDAPALTPVTTDAPAPAKVDDGCEAALARREEMGAIVQRGVGSIVEASKVDEKKLERVEECEHRDDADGDSDISNPSPSRPCHFVCTEDDCSASSIENEADVEVLTVHEELTDDFELLRNTVQDVLRTVRCAHLRSSTASGTKSSWAKRSDVERALRRTNPARFPHPHAVRAFLSESVERGIVVETTIDGIEKLLGLPTDGDEASAAFRPSISVCEGQPPDDMIESMTKRALEVAEQMKFILFVPWRAHPTADMPLPRENVFVQTTKKYALLMFRNLTNAQRAVSENPRLGSGVLVDWRRVEPLRKERVRCPACRKSKAKADMVWDPNSVVLYCRKCFVASIPPAACGNVTTHEVRKVVQLLEMMAENDDLFVHRDVVRELVKERWPNESVKRGAIREAVDAGAVFFFKIPGDDVSCLCLSNLADEALLTPPLSEAVDTTKEQHYVAKILGDNGGSMDRRDVIKILKSKFNSMQTVAARNKLFDDAEENGRFFVARGPFMQAVGLTLADSNMALNKLRNSLGESVEDSALILEEVEDKDDFEKLGTRGLSTTDRVFDIGKDALDEENSSDRDASGQQSGDKRYSQDGRAERQQNAQEKVISETGLEVAGDEPIAVGASPLSQLPTPSDWEDMEVEEDRNGDGNADVADALEMRTAENIQTTQVDEQQHSASQTAGADTAGDSAKNDDSYLWDAPSWNERQP